MLVVAVGGASDSNGCSKAVRGLELKVKIKIHFYLLSNIVHTERKFNTWLRGRANQTALPLLNKGSEPFFRGGWVGDLLKNSSLRSLRPSWTARCAHFRILATLAAPIQDFSLRSLRPFYTVGRCSPPLAAPNPFFLWMFFCQAIIWKKFYNVLICIFNKILQNSNNIVIEIGLGLLKVT